MSSAGLATAASLGGAQRVPPQAPAGLAIIKPRFGEAVSATERAWEAFVETAPGGDVVQTAAWGRGKDAMGFQVAVAVDHDAEGQIESGALIVARRIAVMNGRLPLATVGYVARGPLVAGDDPARIDRAIEAVERTAKAMGVLHLIIQPPAGRDDIAARLALRGYADGAPDVAPNCTIWIDIDREPEAIINGMSRSKRRDLRKTFKIGAICWEGGEADLPLFQSLHAATAERQGFTPLSLDYLEKQWRALRPLGAVAVFFAALPDAPERAIAGSWVTAYAGTMTDKIPGWNGEAPNLNLNVACIWQSVLWARERGIKRFDLGGIDRAATEEFLSGGSIEKADGERNPAGFKARFGGDIVMLPLAWQRTLHPLLWPAVRLAWRQLAGRPAVKAFVNGLRNG